ncbi:PRA1 (Prenylated rab acceptor) family protein [Euphorbia peplus]|nr:PRA1 (Prenylated rab acceptor) family protein [Euphorbia peplus]
MSNNTPEFISQITQTTRTLKSTLRPWSSFLDLSSLNFPSSLPDATTRISQNLTHFRSNYTLIILIILFFSLIFHPLSLIAFLIVAVGWIFLYFSRDEPLLILGYEVSDLVVLVSLFAVTVVVLVWSGVWVNVVVAIAVCAGLVGLHAGLRGTDDLVADDLETSPYSNLLSDDDSPTGGLL